MGRQSRKKNPIAGRRLAGIPCGKLLATYIFYCREAILGKNYVLGAGTFATVQIFICLFLFSSSVSRADSSEERGLEIAREADRRDAGFGDTSVNLSMLMTTPSGSEIVREMRQQTLEVAEDGDKVIMVIDSPADLKGTAILTFTHKVAYDDQWLYLPALKRVKRISSSNKSGPFMGSEFCLRGSRLPGS